jgi:sugar O-acyltransferase (sialic acid O-acetyltransferase NeuD family)
MSKLLILGAGGHGKVVAEIAKLMGLWDKIAFLDDNDEIKEVCGMQVIGRISDLGQFRHEYDNVFVAIGNNRLRIELINKALNEGFNVPILVHPFTSISKESSIGIGTVIMAGVVINPHVAIGKGCIINTSSSIDHDCIIEDGVHISPGAHIGGTVRIGSKTWICIGASIANNITIGSDSIIAAGAAVVKDIESNVLAGGVPARVISMTNLSKY